MSETKFNVRVINKHDTEENWLKAVNFRPQQGELIVYDADDKYSYERFKIGDGVTLVSDLPFSSLAGYSVAEKLNSSDTEIPTSKMVVDALTTNYNESIIGLSVDGTTVTYIKGDGSVHTFETQDTDTTYSLGTDQITGLTKLYATTGSAEDGTMTQKAIKTELDKKVGVTIDDTQNMLIFTI